MSDQSTRSDDRFDDDRLLAFALGLDDDPELQIALESSTALARRLEQTHADVSTVADRLQTAIPAADPDYADPAALRWQRLQPYFASQNVRTRRAPRSRLGRLAAAAAVLAVFAVTVAVAMQRLPAGSGTDRVAETAARNAGGDSLAPEKVAPTLAPVDDAKGQTQDAKAVPLPQAEEFATVCVARAGPVGDDGQRFRVVRVLKGQTDRRLVIALGDGADVLALGSLQVLYLHPLVSGAGQAPDDAGVVTGEIQPTPMPATTTYGGEVMPPALSGYGLGDEAALVQALPKGVDISTLTVP